MAIRKSVFGSKAELRHFRRLEKTWGDKYRLYHNLPFLNVCELSNLIDVDDPFYNPLTLSVEEIDNLKKTSIDYTLCDKHGTPLISIEFDGLKEGYNVGTKYCATGPKNRWREYIMNLKLKVAHGSNFPFFS